MPPTVVLEAGGRGRLACVAVGLVLAACSRKASSPPPTIDASTSASIDASVEAAPTVALRNSDDDGDVSGLFAWARWGERRVLLFADTDARELVSLDAESLEALGRQPLDGAPSAVRIASGDVYVTLADRARLLELRARRDEVGSFNIVHAVKTRAEPVALAASGSEVLVLSGFGRALERFAAGLEPPAASTVTMLPHEPRSLVALPGGDVVVGHASRGPLTVVRGQGRIESIDVTERNVCASVTDHECDGLIHLPGSEHFGMAALDGAVLVAGALSVTTGEAVTRYGSDVASSAQGGKDGPADVVSFSLDLARPGDKEVSHGWRRERFVCALPRALAVDLPHHDVFVACSGNGRVARFRLDKAGEAWAVGTLRGFVSVSGTPLALAVDAKASNVIVWSRDARTLTRLSRSKAGVLVAAASKSLPISTPLDSMWLRGRALFHAADGRISARGLVACAHCHPDGRDDDLVWNTPNGRRRTLALVDLASASSFGWDGRTRTLEEHIDTTIKQRLGGSGLSPDDLGALVAYVRSLRAPVEERNATEGEGPKSFAAAGCPTCHMPSSGFGDGRVHDLGSGMKRTPRLAALGGRRSLFHDGRYTSLGAMLEDPQLSMGHARELSASDRAALGTFLEGL